MLTDFASGGGVWVLTGPPGAGKSHLARRFQEELPPGAGMVWARGGSREETLRPFWDMARHELDAEVRGRAAVGEIAGVPGEVRLIEDLVGLLHDRGKAGPLVLCCDDLESFDATSLACLTAMMWRMDRLSFSLLLLRGEGGDVSPDLVRLWKSLDDVDVKPVRRFRVPPMTPEETEALCRERLGGTLKLGRGKLQWLHRTAGGNPRYLREILDYLGEAEWLVRNHEGWRLVPGTPVAPPGLEELVRRRLDSAGAREPAGAKEVVEHGAVLGMRFPIPLTAAAVRMPPERAASALQRIGERTGYLEPAPGDVAAFRFDHELTREGLLSTMTERRPGMCRRLVRAHAQALHEAHEEQGPASYQLLAYLYEGAGEWRLAAEESSLAAAAALAQGFPSEAARLAAWQDGLLSRVGEGPEEPSRLSAAEIRAEGLLTAGRYRDAVDLLQPLLDVAVRRGRSRLLFLLGAASSRLPEASARTQGIAWLKQARQLFDPAVDLSLAGRIHLELTFAYRRTGDEVGARKTYPRAMDLARRARDLPLQLHLLRLCRLFLEPDTARRHLEHAVEMAREDGLELEEALCLNNLGTVCAELGLLTEASDHFRACLEILELHGRWGIAVPLSNLAFLAVARGDLERAEALLGQASEAAWEPGISLSVRTNGAAVRAMLGEVEEAVRELRQLAAEADRAGDPSIRPAILFNLARALLEAGRPEEALQEATVPPPWLANDEDLALACLARLRLQAQQRLAKQGQRGAPEPGLHRQARVLERTTKVQAWIYRSLWARGDVQFR